MGDWAPDRTVTVDVPDKALGRDKFSRVHLWIVPARVHGRWCADGASLDIAQRFQRFSATLADRRQRRAGDGVRRPHRGDRPCAAKASMRFALQLDGDDAPPRRRGAGSAGAFLRARARRRVPMSSVGFAGWPGIASVPWLYPALEIVHIVGIGLLLGSLVLVELRIWGRGAELPLAPLARFGLRLTLVGFALAAASGTTMFLSQPSELLGNVPFLVKMALLACAGTQRGGVPLARRRRPLRRRRPRPDLGLARALARHHHLRALDRLLLTRGPACNVGPS